MNTSEIFIPIRIPTWDELPEIELYMDQVVGFISRKLSQCFGADDEKSITATMVNNYVKQKLIASPQKKKYDRTQMAQLIIIFLMKKIFSITEIGDFLAYLAHLSDMPTAYDLFGDTLYTMSIAPPASPDAVNQADGDPVICSALRALCVRLYANRILERAVIDAGIKPDAAAIAEAKAREKAEVKARTEEKTREKAAAKNKDKPDDKSAKSDDKNKGDKPDDKDKDAKPDDKDDSKKSDVKSDADVSDENGMPDPD